MSVPSQYLIDRALEVAEQSPCEKSKRGVILSRNGVVVGEGFNGPPDGFTCPGRAACTGTCGLRCVHAEMRAIFDAVWSLSSPGVARQSSRMTGRPAMCELLHVELAPDGGVVPCDGPVCAQCSKHILECCFIGRVWLYVTNPLRDERMPTLACPAWISYEPAEFHELSLIASGAQP